MLSLQFTTETGLADSWTEAFHRISADEVYENPDDDYLVMNHMSCRSKVYAFFRMV